jgi:hypothetical protein
MQYFLYIIPIILYGTLIPNNNQWFIPPQSIAQYSAYQFMNKVFIPPQSNA